MNPAASNRQLSVAVTSPSTNVNAALELFEGFGGNWEMVGVGGGVPSTATFGCAPCSSNAVASRASVVVHVYVCSAVGALAANLIRSVAPGHSSLAGPGGATAWIAMGEPSSVTVQSAVEQLPEPLVVAVRVPASTVNPAGTTTWPLFAAALDALRLVTAIVYVALAFGTTAGGAIVAP